MTIYACIFVGLLILGIAIVLKRGVRFSVPFAIKPAAILKDFILLLSKNGRSIIKKENHDRHALFSFTIMDHLFLIAACFPVVQIGSSPAWCLMAVGGLIMAVWNMVREEMKRRKGGRNLDGSDRVPFSWRDVRAGMYAGAYAGLRVWLIVQFVAAAA